MTPTQLKELEQAIKRRNHRFVSETHYHTICLRIIWPIFKRARLRRFNDLWDSGLSFDDCWKVSK